jgi:hypothetical protein
MAAMAEFLWRGWNVAVPEVDVGEDIFVIEDATGQLSRIQVKTANAKTQTTGYSAQFAVGLEQLRTPRTPELIYVFAIRKGSGWESFVILDRGNLFSAYETHGLGSLSGDNVIFRFTWDGSTLRCGHRDFQMYLNAWSRWPVLRYGQ